MVSALIVGATRGLGASLTKQYATQGSNTVYATSRSSSGPEDFPDSVHWMSNIDLTKPNVGDELAKRLEGKKPLDIVVSKHNDPDPRADAPGAVQLLIIYTSWGRSSRPAAS